jgi:hypothetical protein
VAPILEQQQAESNLALTESEIPQLETQLQLELNRLAVLLGQYPGAVHERLAEPAPIPDPQGGLPASLPCDMIRQRPDIRLAERRIAIRTAELGVAIADLYPRFTINGRFGVESRKLSNLLTGDSFTYNVGPSFTWPLFQAGRILCNIELADAVLEESVAVYEQTVLLAVEEVENAIVSYHKERERFEDLQRTVKASEATLESVLKTYRAGKTDFLNVINSFQTLFVAQNNLAISEGTIVVQLITIYKALGGGWDPSHHCQERCVRLRCSNRVQPGVADITEVEDPTERYFGAQSDLEAAGDDADLDPFGDLEDDEPDLPMPDETEQPRELLFEDELERLQERLQQTPQQEPEAPADDSAQLSRPQREYAGVSLKDFW